LNIDACRVGSDFARPVAGRWPANVTHDGSPEVLAAFPDAPGQAAAVRPDSGTGKKTNGIYGSFGANSNHQPRGDTGSAARFFYTAKADAGDRLGSRHPTVKPVNLIAYLCRLVTPPGGTVLDSFAGSGTTGMACMREGFNAILIEREAEYVADIKRRLAHVSGQDAPLFSEPMTNPQQTDMFSTPKE
jgi:site-specific DNA-methyltransferase (adenine-specific)